MFDDLRRNIVDHFVDIGGIVDDHSLTCLSISFNWREKRRLPMQKSPKMKKTLLRFSLLICNIHVHIWTQDYVLWFLRSMVCWMAGDYTPTQSTFVMPLMMYHFHNETTMTLFSCSEYPYDRFIMKVGCH